MKQNKFISILIFIVNIVFFIPENIDIIRTNGGGFGFGWMIFPFVLFLNLFIISAFLSFIKKYENSILLFWLNLVGIILSGFALGYAL